MNEREFLLDDLVTVFGSTECVEIDCLAFTGAQFNRDFGPFKAGEEVDNVTIDFEKGTLTEHYDGGIVKRQVKFRLEPLDG